jgi:uncharacterized protein
VQINLRELTAAKQEVRLTASLPVDHIVKQHSGLEASGLLMADITALTKFDSVNVTGKLVVPVELVCSRCLTRYCQSLRIPFHESFTKNPDEANQDDEDIVVVTEDRVDLVPYIEEAVLLAFPMAPVCEEECKGLDPVTGSNLNVYPAEKPPERIDPRLAALADFFNKSE